MSLECSRGSILKGYEVERNGIGTILKLKRSEVAKLKLNYG